VKNRENPTFRWGGMSATLKASSLSLQLCRPESRLSRALRNYVHIHIIIMHPPSRSLPGTWYGTSSLGTSSVQVAREITLKTGKKTDIRRGVVQTIPVGFWTWNLLLAKTLSW
jgi:hypothetical protein